MNFIEYVEGTKHAKNGADTSPMHDSFKDAGLELNTKDIVIDIDNLPKDKIKKIIETFDIKTQVTWSDKGAHLWFTKPKGFKRKQNAICALGFPVEYLDKENRKTGVTIKRNGILRTIDNVGAREELPECFTRVRTNESLLGTDNRNNRLHSFKFQIASLVQKDKIMRFINENIFDEPLEEKEFQTVTREEEIRADENNKYEVAMIIARKHKIVKYKGVLYTYDGERYTADENFITIVAGELKGQDTRYIDEIVKQMKYHLEPVEEPKHGFDIKFKNGIIRKGAFIEIDSSEFSPYFLDLEYNPEATPVESIDEFLHHLSHGHDGEEPEEAYKDYILEMVAHCLITDIDVKTNYNFQKVFFMAGGGGNGKGAMFRLIRALLGKGNYKTNKLEQLGDERYIYGMKGMLANTGDDIDDVPIKEKVMSNLKSLSAYEEIEIRKLHAMPVNESITATQIFTTNHILKSFEKGDAWVRRVQWLPMYVTPKKKDPDFYKKLLTDEAMEYFLRLVMEAYDRLRENGDFTFSKKVDKFTNQYHEDNNVCLSWVRDIMKPELILGKTSPEVWNDYETWHMENISGKPQSSRALNAAIKKVYGFTTQPRNKRRVFVDGK